MSSSQQYFCNNGCGFFGSPATLNLCSRCYQEHFKHQPLNLDFTKLSINESTTTTTTTTTTSKNQPLLLDFSKMSIDESIHSYDGECIGGGTDKIRCLSCRKRVGLLGFKCRCGYTFCSLHRYAEEHGCTFDYKGLARNALAQALYRLKPDKLERI